MVKWTSTQTGIFSIDMYLPNVLTDLLESYRKASKLDATCFTTNFHPHDYGILQDIERILLPAFDKGLDSDAAIMVQAELYKLNVGI